MAGAHWFVVLIIVGMYFAPTIVGFVRGHHQRGAIAVLNTLLGWTVLGWIISLVWAASAVRPPAAPRAAA